MSCCICGDLATHMVFKQEPLKCVFEQPIEINFCDIHNFIHITKDPCDKSHHIHTNDECLMALCLFLWSEYKPTVDEVTRRASINIMMGGNTIIETLIRMNKVNVELYFLAIEQLKNIMRIESDHTALFIAFLETNE